MLQTGLQHVHIFLEHLVGLGDGSQRHGAVVVLHIAVEQHSVVALLLGLDHIPVGEAVQTAALEIVGHIKIEIGAVKLLVDLIVKQIGYFFVKHNYYFL